jgi:L-seryl-tRNA(Ser) seleniumtransferase
MMNLKLGREVPKLGVYESLGIRTVINAAGTVTTLGGSLMPPEVFYSMEEAGKAFVEMEKLHDKAGEIIADITGAEAGMVTNGAAAALTLAAAACMTGSERAKMDRLPDTEGMRNEIIVQRGHRNYFDNAFRAAGANFVEVGFPLKATAQQMEDAIGQGTVAIAHTISNLVTDTGLHLDGVIEIAHRADLPVILDAAAMLPPASNLKKFVVMGADLVVFSGGKAICGPQTTGILCGRKDLIEAARLQSCPHFGIGRHLKVGKEEIVGLITALRLYANRDHDRDLGRRRGWAEHIAEKLTSLPHMSVKIDSFVGEGDPGAAPRVWIELDEQSLGKTAREIIDGMKKGDPPIFLKELYSHRGILVVETINLFEDQARVVASRIVDALKK